MENKKQMDELVVSLKKIGLTENEAKAYVGLVALNDANARELHEFTGIPRAKIYEILNNLVGMGYAEVRQGSPIHYQPTDPKEFVRRNRESFINEFEMIERGLKSLNYEKEDESPVWYLKSKWTIDKKIRELIESSKEDITIICRKTNSLLDYAEYLEKISGKVDLLILVEDEKEFQNIGLTVHRNDFIILKNLPNYKRFEKDNGFILISDKKTAMLVQERANIMEGIIISMPFVEYIHEMIHFLYKYLNQIDVTTGSITFTFDVEKEELYKEIEDNEDK